MSKKSSKSGTFVLIKAFYIKLNLCKLVGFPSNILMGTYTLYKFYENYTKIVLIFHMWLAVLIALQYFHWLFSPSREGIQKISLKWIIIYFKRSFKTVNYLILNTDLNKFCISSADDIIFIKETHCFTTVCKKHFTN